MLTLTLSYLDFDKAILEPKPDVPNKDASDEDKAEYAKWLRSE